MNDPHSPTLHGWNQQPPGFGGEMYPGLGDPFYAGPPMVMNPTVLPAQQAGATATKGSGFTFGDIKGMLDRVGGVDGVLNGMGKFQKFMVTFKQMAPLFRLFMGKGGATAAAAGVKSHQRRRTNSTTRRSPTGSKGRSRRTSGKRR